MKQFYISGNSFPCLILTLIIFFILPFQAISSNSFFNDGGVISASQTVFMNETPATLVETGAPAFAGPYEYLWMISIPSDPVLNQWNPIPGATNPDFTFSGPITVTSLYTRCVRLAGSNDDYVETNAIAINLLNALPIDLISFTAKDNGNGTVQLDWVTASERNNEFFQIESSNDGIDFKELGRIEGAIDSEERNYYSYQDQTPFFGNNYYRLKQVDSNGDFEYFDIISIKLTKGFREIISLFPNPVSDNLNLKINIPLENNPKLEVINTIGQIVFELNSINSSSINLDFQNLLNGVYYLKIIDNKEVIFLDKFIKL